MENRCRYLLLLLIAITLFDLWIILHFYQPASPNSSNMIWSYFREKRFNLTNRTLTIQWRTNFFNRDAYKLFGGGRLPFSACFVEECKFIPITAEEEADVLLFHNRNPPNIPPRRLPKQKYVFFSQESEVHENPKPIIYNLTMTYRLDSDIPTPYGAFKKRIKPRQYAFQKDFNFARGKAKKVAWVVSNCKTQSEREKYVNELKRHIDVDIYGKCGTLPCVSQNCFAMINHTYKFYLAFENSICDDYITEKLYRTMGMGGIIPVVLGGANYSQLVPPHSVINVMDYSSPRALAEYLYKLDRNDTLYNEYFQWQDHYVTGHEETIWCRLCKYLHANINQTKVYGNIREWYSAAKQCRKFKWVTWTHCVYWVCVIGNWIWDKTSESHIIGIAERVHIVLNSSSTR